MKENKNLNTLLAWVHAKVIEELLAKVECNVVIADQFGDEKYIRSKLQERGKQVRIVQMHQADD